MRIVALVNNIPGIGRGKLYEVLGFCSRDNSVKVNSSLKYTVWLQLDSQALLVVDDNISSKPGGSEMLLSFMEAVESCGGSVESLLNRDPKLSELIATLAPNGVRFVHDKNFSERQSQVQHFETLKVAECNTKVTRKTF